MMFYYKARMRKKFQISNDLEKRLFEINFNKNARNSPPIIFDLGGVVHQSMRLP